MTGRLGVMRPDGEGNPRPCAELAGPDHGRYGRRRVLVVGTEERLLSFVTRALEVFRPGYTVATAGTEDQALQWMRVLAPQVVILDCDPPPAGGAELRRLIESTRSSHMIRMGTHQTDPAGRSTALAKPVSLPLLLATLREVQW